MSDSTPPALDPALAALIQQGLSKSGVMWLGPSPDEARAVWFAYLEPHAYVLTGEDEQPLPDLGTETTLVLRSKETRARLAVVPAEVERITPEDDRWTAATVALAKARLNANVLPSELPARWAQSASVFALTPDPARAVR